jgi:hypothetical protein
MSFAGDRKCNSTATFFVSTEFYDHVWYRLITHIHSKLKCSPVARPIFLTKIGKPQFEVIKDSEKNLDIVNAIFYKSVKSQHKILIILGYTKMIKSDNSWIFENLHCSLFEVAIVLNSSC